MVQVMAYDKDVFQKFKEQAIIKATDIAEGCTYYSNVYPDGFEVKKLLTAKEVYEKAGLEVNTELEEDWEALNWVAYEITGTERFMSLSDNNIGEDSNDNPWLIFADSETAHACEKELTVQWVEEEDPLLGDTDNCPDDTTINA